MLTGKLLFIDTEAQSGKIEQDGNQRIYDFAFSVWDVDSGVMEVGVEVEFEVEMRVVIKVLRKPEPIDPNAIPMTTLPHVCVAEFFARENEILQEHSECVDGQASLDFLRMRRFLFTAYNDLCEMDSLIENEPLRKAKHEISALWREFESFVKKAQYTPNYAFEQIFLAKQTEYIAIEKNIESTQSALGNAKAQSQTLGNNLDIGEKKLQRMANRGGHDYEVLEKEVKSMRKTHVDLLHFVATKQEWIVQEKARLKTFKDVHFEEFIHVYTPMLKDIKERFLALLNAKAYALDASLWARAKKSQIVRKFFRDARIEGGFSSKTFLRYFLRGLDRSKASPKTKELFQLLKYLEEVSHKHVLVLRTLAVNANKYKEVIEKIDSTLSIHVETHPQHALKLLAATHHDIIVLDEQIGEMSALEFIQHVKQIPQSSHKAMIFCLVVAKIPAFEEAEEARTLGVQYFILEQDMDMLFDSVRMAL